MRKLLARGLVIVIEVSLYALAELIMKRSKTNGNYHGLHRGYFGRSDGIRGAGHSLHAWRLVRPAHGRRRFIS